MKLIVSSAAAADIERLHAFLVEKNPGAAGRAVARIVGAIERLLTSPNAGRPSSINGARELLVPFGKSAYMMRYSFLAETNEIVIIRIWHGREDRHGYPHHVVDS